MSEAVDRLVAALEARALSVRGSGERGYRAQCPGHEDRNASLSVGVGGDGRVLLHCHAGCQPAEVLAVLGFQWRDLFPESDRHGRRGRLNLGGRGSHLASEEQLVTWSQALLANAKLVERLRELRGWTRPVLEAHLIGWEGERVVIPIRDRDGALVGVQRYLPNAGGHAGLVKMLSVAGAQRQLFPAPEAVGDDVLWLVEGEPDALSVLSLGLSAVAVPGAQAWRPEYAPRFVGRDVVVCCDCDEPGRALAAQAAGDLFGFASSVRVIDLDASRADGCDVGDLVCEAAAQGAAGLVDARYLLATMAEHAQPVVVDLADPHPPAPRSDLGELLDAIGAFIRRYVVLPGEHEATALALFILHTWAIDGAHATPYLLVISPEKRSGKTRLLEVLALLVRAPWHTNSTSEAALFRKIEQATPTLLLDEIDAIFGSSSDLDQWITGVFVNP